MAAEDSEGLIETSIAARSSSWHAWGSRTLLSDLPAAGADIFHIHQGTIIKPGKPLVMLRGVTRLALNDDYDGVQLRYPDGNLADAVCGFVRAGLTRQDAAAELLDRTRAEGYVKQV